jgi:hypothetical protein
MKKKKTIKADTRSFEDHKATNQGLGSLVALLGQLPPPSIATASPPNAQTPRGAPKKPTNRQS